MRSTLSTGLGPRRPMVVVEADDAVHSLYGAGTQTPDGGEVEAGRQCTQQHSHIRVRRGPQ